MLADAGDGEGQRWEDGLLEELVKATAILLGRDR
jgi:hypothetical protein